MEKSQPVEESQAAVEINKLVEESQRVDEECSLVKESQWVDEDNKLVDKDSQPEVEEHEEPQVVEQGSVYENSEDDVVVDGVAVDGGLKGKEKGKTPASDDELFSDVDSGYNDQFQVSNMFSDT